MDKKIITILSCFAVLVIVLAVVIFYVFINKPAPSTMIYTDPQTINAAIGQNFTINIMVSNITDLYGWQLKLRWNITILEVANINEGVFLRTHGATFFHQTINETGYLVLDVTLLGDVSGVSGNGMLATVQFHVKENGNCDLQLYDTVLINSSEQTIAHTVRDSHFSTQSS